MATGCGTLGDAVLGSLLRSATKAILAWFPLNPLGVSDQVYRQQWSFLGAEQLDIIQSVLLSFGMLQPTVSGYAVTGKGHIFLVFERRLNGQTESPTKSATDNEKGAVARPQGEGKRAVLIQITVRFFTTRTMPTPSRAPTQSSSANGWPVVPTVRLCWGRSPQSRSRVVGG